MTFILVVGFGLSLIGWHDWAARLARAPEGQASVIALDDRVLEPAYPARPAYPAVVADFRRSATLAIPAFAQASSVSCVDPALPTAPIVSSPT